MRSNTVGSIHRSTPMEHALTVIMIKNTLYRKASQLIKADKQQIKNMHKCVYSYATINLRIFLSMYPPFSYARGPSCLPRRNAGVTARHRFHPTPHTSNNSSRNSWESADCQNAFQQQLNLNEIPALRNSRIHNCYAAKIAQPSPFPTVVFDVCVHSSPAPTNFSSKIDPQKHRSKMRFEEAMPIKSADRQRRVGVECMVALVRSRILTSLTQACPNRVCRSCRRRLC